MDVFQGGNDNNILSGFAFRKMLEIKPKSAKLEVKSKKEIKERYNDTLLYHNFVMGWEPLVQIPPWYK